MSLPPWKGSAGCLAPPFPTPVMEPAIADPARFAAVDYRAGNGQRVSACLGQVFGGVGVEPEKAGKANGHHRKEG